MASYGKLKKSSLAETLEESSCAVCQSIIRMSGGCLHVCTSTSDWAAEIKEGLQTERAVCSACEVLRKEKQLGHCEEHGSGSTANHEKEIEESEVPNQDKLQRKGQYCSEHCLLSSSLYYGGPDGIYDIHQARKEAENVLKMAVNQLEEAMDPFHLECTTRGNWWQGIQSFSKTGMNDGLIFVDKFQKAIFVF